MRTSSSAVVRSSTVKSECYLVVREIIIGDKADVGRENLGRWTRQRQVTLPYTLLYGHVKSLF